MIYSNLKDNDTKGNKSFQVSDERKDYKGKKLNIDDIPTRGISDQL